MLIDDAVLAKLRKLIPLAPLHQPHNLAGIRRRSRAFPERRRSPVSTRPSIAATISSPTPSPAALVLRRRRAALRLPRPVLRIHHPPLPRSRRDRARGRDRRPSRQRRLDVRDQERPFVATTMGFSALDGLPMGTRCGQLDPGVLLYLMAEKKMTRERSRTCSTRSPA